MGHRQSVGLQPQTLDSADGAVPIDNNWCENQIRPWALGRSNWLFAGSLRSGKRAAAIMSLIQSARLNGHDPYAYLKDVLTRLPMQRASEIDQLLPHRWISTVRHIHHGLTKINTFQEF
ncbi:putative transposase [Pseudomonas coronafaciens pv. oryzae]|nr:putative transposase [Pseudomonas coronafaciens pv. oryzae]RMS96170.1 putative transposase [Pseudomonas coronafaciens pv. oryzae]